MKIIVALLFLFFNSVLYAAEPAVQNPKEFETITAKTGTLRKYSGYFPFYWDEREGKIWLEIDQWNTEFLYVNSLPAGIGSNDIGLDRGQLGESRVVKFTRIGPRVLLIQPNYGFRAVSKNPDERRSVEESFAQSVLWGFTVSAQEGERALVDATDFFLRDARNVVGVLKNTKQGDYKLETSRSAIYLPRTKNFPKNTEVETILTFVGREPGDFVTSVVPTPTDITVREHHSFVQLPDQGYQPREWDPRSGFYAISYMDYATPLGEPLRKRWIARHRLIKKDPSAAVSEPVQPIIYYLDRGTPEPIRSALLQGAEWWNAAFEQAGFRNAFQVRLMPEDADPMDVRYNVIQWVHRSTRGWSYGNTVYDPRTGEIIQGHVTLGSLRVRQDYLIAEGLLSPYEEGKKPPLDMQEMALARLRQLSAHEVGHTLGLEHNFIASTLDRASVMDYPHPYVRLKPDGSIDLSQAYAVGIGEWDKQAIAYGYSQFPPGSDEKVMLDKLVRSGIAEGLIFITDDDARPPGSAHPQAHLWDNGDNAVDELNRVMDVRRQILSKFSVKNIPEGAPMATLEEVLVPMYLFHRYQVQAAAKVLGGLFYTYAERGDNQNITEMVPPVEQRRAVEALLNTLKTKELMLPEDLVRNIPPHPPGYERTREVFKQHTGGTFDPIAAAETAADLTIGLMLHPDRAARLIEFHARDQNSPGLDEVISDLLSATWNTPSGNGYSAEVKRAVDSVALYHLMKLAADEEASQQVRAVASFQLEQLRLGLKGKMQRNNSKDEKAHFFLAVQQIERFQKDPKILDVSKPPEQPAGAPIGSEFVWDDCAD
jgi:hypothetical protein